VVEADPAVRATAVGAWDELDEIVRPGFDVEVLEQDQVGAVGQPDQPGESGGVVVDADQFVMAQLDRRRRGRCRLRRRGAVGTGLG
jgi:hypothetical protein